MGRRFEEVSDEMKLVPYHVVKPKATMCASMRAATKWAPPQISAMILQKLKQAAEEYLGQPVTAGRHHRAGVLQRRPASGHQGSRPIAGLEVSASSTSRPRPRSRTASTRRPTTTIAVYDFGGGTFDISILEVGDGVVEVKSTNGDTHLGGDNLDQRVIEWIIAEFKKQEGIDLSKDRMALQRLREAAEKAKIELSTHDADRHQPAVHHRRCVRCPSTSRCSCRAPSSSRSSRTSCSGRSGRRGRR